MNQDIQSLQKKYAALAFALGVARSALSDVIDGDFTIEQMQRVFDATAAFNIARSIRMPDDALDIYWDDHLNDVEKYRIKGFSADDAE